MSHTVNLVDSVVLTEEEGARLLVAVATRVAEVVTKQGAASLKIAARVSEIANRPVIGAFVSFKRDGTLRSCMGCLAESMTLGDAVEQATWRAVHDDPRFPPITSGELNELTLEVWLLWGMTEVQAQGAARRGAVIIGQHGLQISCGNNRGLLLPSVAIEHKMDAEVFLEALCQKAGLPRGTWQSANARLSTFEGRVVRADFADIPIGKSLEDSLATANRFQCAPSREESVPMLAETHELCQTMARVFLDMWSGRRPAALYSELWNGYISGAAIMLALPDRPLMTCSKVTVRPENLAQATLISLVEVMFEQVQRLGVTPQEFDDGAMHLAILTDATIHGTWSLGGAASYDVSTVETAERAVMVSGENGWIILYRPDAAATTLVTDGANYITTSQSQQADVISLAISTTLAPLLITSLPSQDTNLPNSRPTAVAGSFYPANPVEMNSALDKLWGIASDAPRRASAIMLPHAGWIYSGELAAKTLQSVVVPQRVIIFAPKHTAGGIGWSVAPYRSWRIPGGEVQSDRRLVTALGHNVDLFHLDETAHEREHAIEVLLPMLSRCQRDLHIAGVTLASAPWHLIAATAEQLAEIIKREETQQEVQPLLVISSDLHHFATQEQTLRVDSLVLDAIATLNPEQVLRVVYENKISMCGVTACVLVMETLRRLGCLNKATIVGHTTSAAVSGDTRQVVGYAGIIFE